MISSSQQDKDGPRSLESAYKDLRFAIVHGNMTEADSLCRQVCEILSSQGEPPEPLAGRIQEELGAIINGVSGIISGDLQSGLDTLESVAHSEVLPDSIRWAVWLWMTRGARDAGDLPRTRTLMEKVIQLAESLDPLGKSTSLCALAEVLALDGDTEGAAETLALARQLIEGIDERRGLSAALLAQARIMSRLGQDSESDTAAARAMQLEPTWLEPGLFVAARYLKSGQLDKVEKLLDELSAARPIPIEVRRLSRLLRRVRHGQFPLWVVNEYLQLRDSLPGEAVVGELQTLLEYSPKFFEVQEELAWKLMKIGELEESRVQFDDLANKDLDRDLHASVKLGLASLAARRESHRPPGVRVKAAVSASGGVSDDHISGEPPAPASAPSSPDTHAAILESIEKIKLPSSPHLEIEAEPPGEQEIVLESSPPPPPPPLERPAPRAAQPSAEEGMKEVAVKRLVFSGDLQTLSIPDVLDFLKNGRRTGTLVISSPDGVGAVYLRNGMITSAASPRCPNIGTLLLSEDKISKGELEYAAQDQRSRDTGPLLGAILMELGILDAETIQAALRAQAFVAIQEMFGWTEGQFALSPETPGEQLPSELNIEIDPQFVLLEVARMHDEDNR